MAPKETRFFHRTTGVGQWAEVEVTLPDEAGACKFRVHTPAGWSEWDRWNFLAITEDLKAKGYIEGRV